ncbi:predicted protein [Plenodomus lingam JN3]|uniref:Predicted protein n=1 Tax=Leptosphaeria maculans (strain JN3 / isolate v23.1.3 / race Av1-4-5-6-7-8) TaxID=985895 RepID=E5AD25_LEPMJ|nr:predicted protein [Plenodomus lingam JN3]CBY02377.1 predicted protein [Plenodomus lingam JN3]
MRQLPKHQRNLDNTAITSKKHNPDFLNPKQNLKTRKRTHVFHNPTLLTRNTGHSPGSTHPQQTSKVTHTHDFISHVHPPHPTQTMRVPVPKSKHPAFPRSAKGAATDAIGEVFMYS